ncbi:MAG: T9SS type A sorting domain-containing protein [Bacteroidia bacterium]
MRYLLLIIISALCSIYNLAYAQTPIWQWVKSANGNHFDIAVRSCTDASGNLIVAGSYFSTPLSFQNNVINSNGGYDVFIAKYDAAGNEMWIRSFGNVGEESVNDIACDGNGNIYLTGTYNNNILFGGDSLLTSNFQYSMFLIKYDSLGNEIWGKGVRGTSLVNYVVGHSLQCNNSNDVIVIGRFKSQTILFDSLVVNDINNVDVLLAKYNSGGVLQWAQSIGGIMDDWGLGVDCDNLNNIYITGMYGANGITIGSFTLPNSGSSDVFLAKLDSAGVAQWATRGIGASSEVARSVSVSNNGDTYITGNFESPILSFGSINIYNNGESAMFIAKYNSLGSVVWAKNSSGPGLATGYDIDTYGTNEIYVTGWYDSTFVSFDTTSLISSGGEDVYIAKYNGNGNLEWVTGPTGNLNERCYGVTASPNGDITITGMFESSPVEFGSLQLNNTTSTYQDLFIARLSKPTSTAEIIRSSDIIIGPNPSNGVLYVQLPNGIHTLSLSDVQGRIISNFKGSGTLEIRIDSPGLYILKSTSGTPFISKVLVVEAH